MNSNEISELIENRTRVKVPTRHEIIATATAHAEGIIIAHGLDVIRGQWVQVQSDDGIVIEISERQPITVEIERIS